MIKKHIFIGILLGLIPNMVLGYSARYNQLVQEKERKMAELEKCQGSTKGLKIAGISTLGLTAVGVAGNIVEAKKLGEYDTKIEKTKTKIASTETEIENKQAEIIAKQKQVEEEKAAAAANVAVMDTDSSVNNSNGGQAENSQKSDSEQAAQGDGNSSTSGSGSGQATVNSSETAEQTECKKMGGTWNTTNPPEGFSGRCVVVTAKDQTSKSGSSSNNNAAKQTTRIPSKML